MECPKCHANNPDDMTYCTLCFERFTPKPGAAKQPGSTAPGAVPGEAKQPAPANPAGGAPAMGAHDEAPSVTVDATDIIIDQMRSGNSKYAIIEDLMKMGMCRNDAALQVETAYVEATKLAAEEQITPASILPAIIGGGLAAIAGGIVWALVAILSDYELGILAAGMGALTGGAVVLFTGGKKGFIMQAIAILSGLLGIVIGKYLMFFHVLKIELAKKLSAAEVDAISRFSINAIGLFIETLPEMCSPFDVLWIVLAVVFAWRIPRPLSIEVRDDQTPTIIR